MIVNIRGTSGSGKTTAVNQLMNKAIDVHRLVDVYGTSPKERVYGYELTFEELPRKIYVLGRYETACGGCDAFAWPGAHDFICDQVKEMAAKGHVVYEGLLISHIYQRYANLAKACEPESRTVFAFLDTPLELCLARVQDRRNVKAASKGQEASTLNPVNTTQKWHDARRVAKRFEANGFEVRWLPHEEPGKNLYKWFADLLVNL